VKPTISLGRIAGVPVGVNWSVLVVMALIVWTLAAAVFPDAAPDLDTTAYVVMGVIGALVFLTSILLHELGHAVQAQRDDMEIEGITLWLFGGVASFRGMFPSAGAEFRIAIAGPLVTLALGIMFVALSLVPAMPDEVVAVAAWLGVINLVILVFNLLPAFPLDGGRILRSALWARSGNFAQATERAARAGRVIAFALIGLGVLAFMLTGALGGAWIALIGWFLLMAAGAEANAILAREALRGLRVRDVMSVDPVTAPPGMALGRFMDDIVWRSRFTTYPVADDGRPAGLLPFRRVARVARTEWDTRRVDECMVPLAEVVIVDGDDPLTDAATRLYADELGRALVVEDGRLTGLLSVSDVARALELRQASQRATGSRT
jgi:Zn-dependent protease/CBS domain-containing protein